MPFSPVYAMIFEMHQWHLKFKEILPYDIKIKGLTWKHFKNQEKVEMY